MTRPILPAEQVRPAAAEAIAQFHADVVARVQQAVAQHPVVIVGMAQNPVVKRARKELMVAGIPFEYMEFGSYFSQWKPRLAIKLWSGWPTYPQVFVRGQLVGGHAEMHAALQDGSLRALLANG